MGATRFYPWKRMQWKEMDQEEGQASLWCVAIRHIVFLMRQSGIAPPHMYGSAARDISLYFVWGRYTACSALSVNAIALE